MSILNEVKTRGTAFLGLLAIVPTTVIFGAYAYATEQDSYIRRNGFWRTINEVCDDMYDELSGEFLGLK